MSADDVAPSRAGSSRLQQRKRDRRPLSTPLSDLTVEQAAERVRDEVFQNDDGDRYGFPEQAGRDFARLAFDDLTRSNSLPLDQLLALQGKKLKDSEMFGDYMAFLARLRASALRKRQAAAVIDPEAFDTTPPLVVILKCLGFLQSAPCLRLYFLHQCLAFAIASNPTDSLSSGWSSEDEEDVDERRARGPRMPRLPRALARQTADAIDMLYHDSAGYCAWLEHELRQFLLSDASSTTLHNMAAPPVADASEGDGTEADGKNDGAEQRDTKASSAHPTSFVDTPRVIERFGLELHERTNTQVSAARLAGPHPALVVLPSLIRAGAFGLFVRGELPEKTTIAIYGGADVTGTSSEDSGYRMAGSNGRVVDAVDVRCLASMANDAIYTPFENNCGFRRANGVSLTTTMEVEDEELFVPYGNAFKLDFIGTMRASCRAYHDQGDKRCTFLGAPSTGFALAHEYLGVYARHELDESDTDTASSDESESERRVEVENSTTRREDGATPCDGSAADAAFDASDGFLSRGTSLTSSHASGSDRAASSTGHGAGTDANQPKRHRTEEERAEDGNERREAEPHHQEQS